MSMDEERLAKWRDLETLREAFPYTVEGLCLFAQFIISSTIVGNPTLNRMQADILRFLFTGHKFRMIMAQRGQAKTTLTAIYAVFMLIHFPHFRIVIFSQNSKRAKEIAGWIVKIFNRVPVLEFMKPDKNAGDKASIESFDIHWLLRGDDKAPSVSCYSIESGAQGSRADIIIADDIESLQNSRTVGGRAWLEEQTLEFESINQKGDIIYLGTPQSTESIYNTLPKRGYAVRIWTGRYPTNELLEHYGEKLAPIIRMDIARDPSLQFGGGLDGSMGQPTCPEMYDNDALNEKELGQGKAKFLLQFMLYTGLSDADRYPLKLSDLIVASFNVEKAPVMPIWAASPATLWQSAPRYGSKRTDIFHYMMPVTYDSAMFECTIMYIDPAGGGKNGDETAYAIIKTMGTYIYIYDIGAVKGGYEEEGLMFLVMAAKNAKCKKVYIENNYGNGAHVAALKPYFESHYPVEIEAVQESGQKELRIIDCIEPVLSTHRLVVRPEVVQRDIDTIQQYPAEKRMSYSLFYQLSNITREKNCLGHDDRLDALAGAIRQIVESLDYDMLRVVMQRQVAQQKRWYNIMKDPKAIVQYMTNLTLGISGEAALQAGAAGSGSMNVLSSRFNASKGRRGFGKW